MFFYIGKNCPVKSLRQKTETIYLDDGWTEIICKNQKVFYKGYSTDCRLDDNIENIIDGYKPNGVWAVITTNHNLYHPILRPFPVYYYDDNTNNITNIFYDPSLKILDYNIETIAISENKISLDDAVEKIDSILKTSIINFYRYNDIDRMQVLYSAGLDTLTVWALLDNLGYEYDLHVHLPKKTEKTYRQNMGVVREYESDLLDILDSHWGYKQTRCYKNKNWYLTGFYSERIQLREVDIGHAIANFFDKKLSDLPKRKDYLYYFLQRPQNQKNKSPKFNNVHDLLTWANKTIFTDYQMWHIDNNFHFSPLYDIRITQVINELSLDDIITNAFTGYIQKKIVEKNKPTFLNILSEYKNELDIWQNFKNNFDKIILGNVVNKYIT